VGRYRGAAWPLSLSSGPVPRDSLVVSGVNARAADDDGRAVRRPISSARPAFLRSLHRPAGWRRAIAMARGCRNIGAVWRV